MNPVYPFRLHGNEDRAAVRTAIQKVQATWVSTWFASAPDGDVEFGFDSDPRPPNAEIWTVVKTDPENWMAWQTTARSGRDYARLLLNAPLGPRADITPLIERLLGECLVDLAIRVFDAAGLGQVTEDPEQVALGALRIGYGSGAMFGVLGGGLPHLPFAIGGATAAGLIGRPQRTAANAGPIQPRESAIAGAVAKLEVILGQAELTLAELANVSIGDVIRLQSPFREPLTVKTCGGRPVVRARLGASRGRKAIQIIDRAK